MLPQILDIINDLTFSTTVKHLSSRDILSEKLPVPPLAEQRRIADFLDAEMDRSSKIETLYRRLIESVEDRRNSLIDSYIMGKSTSEKRVSVGRFGELPKSWSLLPLRRLVPRVGVGIVVNPSSYFSHAGVPFLHGGNIQEFNIDVSRCKYMTEAVSKRLWRSRLDPGDVVVVRAGHPGRAAVVPLELSGANCASILIIKRSEIMDSRFLAAFFNSPLGKAQVESVRYGAAQEQINVGHVVDFLVPAPPLTKQLEMMNDMDDEIRAIADVRKSALRQLDLLAERRKTLITAAVTGQLDVVTARSGI